MLISRIFHRQVFSKRIKESSITGEDPEVMDDPSPEAQFPTEPVLYSRYEEEEMPKGNFRLEYIFTQTR